MRRIGSTGMALGVMAAMLFGAPAGAQVDTSIPARVTVVNPPISEASYPGIDYGRSTKPRDDREASTTWRVVEETGNCCETYLTTTAAGRLLDFGGRYIYFSDDRGVTWRRVEPLVPLVNGEGAIVAAPGGDVLGVEWDPYSGDHLQFYKFEADTQQWLYTEMPVHQPFYDREWIAVLPGPVTIDGRTHEYVSFVKGGIPKEVWFYSTDGLNYTQVTSKDLDRFFLSGSETQAPLGTTANPDSDWIQENTNGGMTQLGAGDLLASPDFFGGWSLLDGDTFTWSSYTFPDGSDPEGLFQVDSAGWVHNVIPSQGGASFEYRISIDGAQTWKELVVELPKNHTINEIDFRANHEASVAAVAMRAHDAITGNDQDLVYKLDISKPGPRLVRLHEVGLGDLAAVAGVGNAVRFDFESVAIFPDGRVAVSFLDSTTTMHHPVHGTENFAPAIAVEGDTTVGAKIPPPPEAEAPVLGEPYASYTFDQDAEGWATTGIPTWLRGAPGTKSGPDDPATASFGIEGAMYVNNMNAGLTSPPIATDAGQAVLEFWLKADTEEGFDYLHVEWSADGTNWIPISRFSGQNEGYPNWSKLTVGFDSPGGEVRVRFQFVSDLLCSGIDPACGTLWNGLRVDEVVVGRQAT